MAAIDITDPWPLPERERISRGLLATAERLRKNERLSLHVISGRAERTSAPWQGFQRCKSADPNSVNHLQENERLILAEYQQQFLEPLKELLPQLTNGRAAPQSPILEAVEVLMWSPHFAGHIQHRTLELYSDLVQHSAVLSHLSGRLPDACTVLASNIGQRLKGHDWRGVRVVLHYLRNARDAARQGPAHLRFWTSFFYLLGAAEVYDGPTLVANAGTACGPRTKRVGRNK
jgi:hypothetical protein